MLIRDRLLVGKIFLVIILSVNQCGTNKLIKCFCLFLQILIQVKDLLAKLPSLVEITLKEVNTFSLSG